MTRISHGEVDSIHLPSVGHDVESEIQRSAPHVFDFHVVQLRINVNHSPPHNLRAPANGVCCSSDKCRAPAAEHATVGSEPVIVKIIFRLVTYPVARA